VTLGAAYLRAPSCRKMRFEPWLRRELRRNPFTSLNLRFTIDKYTRCIVPFCVLSRSNLADPARHSGLNSRPFNLLQPLSHSQKSQLLCHQAYPASSYKTPGMAVSSFSSFLHAVSTPQRNLWSVRLFFLLHLRTQPLTTRKCALLFARPLFSCSRELFFPQALCFHNHPICLGMAPPDSPRAG